MVRWQAIRLEFAALEDIKAGGEPPAFLYDPILEGLAREEARRLKATGLSRAARRWQGPSPYVPTGRQWW